MNEVNTQNPPEIATYEIPARNLGTLEARLTKLARKATKLGQALTWTKGPSQVKRVGDDITGMAIYAAYVNVMLCGATPRIGGWRFAAVIEHGSEAGNIIRTVPSKYAEPIPAKYRECDPTCDHCNLLRRRTETFLLQHEGRPAGAEWKRVGRNCLKDFLGHADPHQLAEWAQLLSEASGYCEASEQDEGHEALGRRLTEVRDLVALSFAAIREAGGFKSQKLASETGIKSTKTRVMGSLYTKNPVDKLEVNAGDFASAEAALDWVRGFESNADLSDFDHNLLVVAKSVAVGEKNFGIACYIAEAHRRELGIQAERRLRTNEHVGTPGERRAFGQCVVTYATSFETQFGTKFMFVLRDIDGRTLKVGGIDLGISVGDVVVISGAFIKAHSEYKGTKITEINRVDCCLLSDLFFPAPF